MPDTTVNPHETALLVLDYQPAVLDTIANGAELLARAIETIAIARTKGVHIGFVRVAFDDADRAAIPPTNKAFFPVVGTTYLDHEAPEALVHEKLAPKPGDMSLRKRRVGAFSTTDLDQQLRERGVTTLLLAGTYTSGVVLSTMRDASDHDYRLFVVSDLCGDPDVPLHDVLMQKIFPRQGEVLTSAELGSSVGWR
jgi:nicotinamidase-related amidase